MVANLQHRCANGALKGVVVDGDAFPNWDISLVTLLSNVVALSPKNCTLSAQYISAGLS